MRLILLIGHLKAGGAERVMSVLANYWAAQGREITLITIQSTREDFYPLNEKVTRIGFGLRGRHVIQNIRLLRREIKRTCPDAVISFMPTENLLSLLASIGTRTRNIICEHIDPREQQEVMPVRWLRYVLYRTAYAVVVLSERIRPWAEGIAPKERVHVIPNPVALSLYEAFPVQQKMPGHTIAAIGRLTLQKGFDVLISAFASIASVHPTWSLVIIGEGPERSRLAAMAEELGLQNRVSLPGRTPNTIGFLRSVDMFVMSSRYEGFPMTLIEAMACGLPVISTRWNGVSEIVQDGIDGVLVPPNDPPSLAAAMNHLMSHSMECKRLGTRALEVSKRYDLDEIMGLWEGLITDQRNIRAPVHTPAQDQSFHASRL